MTTQKTSEAIVAEAIANALADQPWWLKRKATILMVLQAVGWVLAVATTYASALPEAVALAIGVVSTLTAALVNAFTKDGFTGSMPERAAEYAPEYTPAHVPYEVPNAD